MPERHEPYDTDRPTQVTDVRAAPKPHSGDVARETLDVVIEILERLPHNDACLVVSWLFGRYIQYGPPPSF